MTKIENIELEYDVVKASLSMQAGLHSCKSYDIERLHQNENNSWSTNGVCKPDFSMFPTLGALLPAEKVFSAECFDGEYYHFDGQIYLPKAPVYTYIDKAYTMGNHGFYRTSDMDILVDVDATIPELLDYNKESCTMRLVSDERTLKQYPFEFEYLTRYDLIEEGLKKTHTIKNTGQDTMYFCNGDHTAFKIYGPIENYELYLEQDEPYYVEHPIIGRVESVNKYLSLDGDMIIDAQSLQLENFQSNICYLIRKGRIAVRYEGIKVKNLWIWTAERNGFICIEPIIGTVHALNNLKKSVENNDIISLEPGKEYVRTLKMTFPYIKINESA